MRLFIALEPSPDFREALAGLQDRLRAAGVAARYDAPSNFHLTLAFIGEWTEEVTALLPRVEEPFFLVLSHPGVFPKAKVLWAGVEPSLALDNLARHVRDLLEEAEIPFDRRPFYPHITLARKPLVPEGLDLSRIAVPPAVMTVRNVCLYRSQREESGMAYTVIGRKENEKEEAIWRQTRNT